MKLEDIRHFFLIPTLIGLIGGASAYLFRYVISLFEALYRFFNIDSWQYFHIITMPLIFLGSHLIIKKFLRNRSNVTIEEVAKKISLMTGKFSMLKGFLVLLLTSISIGFGVPIGREGPIAKLGGLFSEVFIKLFKVENINAPIYLSAGVSAALAATFNAPIAGIFFGIEIIIGKINSYIVIPLIVACTTATLFAHKFIGYYTAFYVPQLDYNDEFFWFIPLGALFFTLIAVVLKYSFNKLKILRRRYRSKWHYFVIVMGVAVGLIISFIPEVKGVGYVYVSKLFEDVYVSHYTFEVFLAKLVAVILSLGSGMFGGIMSPSIFLGAFGGYWFGSEFGSFGFDPRIFALIGSAAVLAGTSKAPLRSAIIITELTHSYQLLLPILLSSAISVYFLSKMEPGSYFKRSLMQRGIDIDNSSIMNFMKKCDIMQYVKKIQPIKADDNLSNAIKKFRRQRLQNLPVVNDEGVLIGSLALKSIRKPSFVLKRDKVLVKDIMSERPFYIESNNLEEGLFKAFTILNTTYVPYVDSNKKYQGVINLNSLLKALSLCKIDYKIR